MRRAGTERGFTLVEAIIVIVVIGIMAAIAFPKYLDARTDAKLKTLKGVADSISAAAAQNYAVKASGAAQPAYSTVGTCAAAAGLVGMPTNMAVTQTVAPGSGALGTCVINYTGSDALASGYSFKVMGA